MQGRSSFIPVATLTIIAVVIGSVIVFSDPKIRIIAVVITSFIVFFTVISTARIVTLKNAILFLWVLLISHRAFILRVERGLTASMEDVLMEIVVTTLVFVSSILVGIAYAKRLTFLRASSVHFWLLGYTSIAVFSITWAPNRFYAAFWVMRLMSTILLLTVYFDQADKRSVRSFVTATLIGMLPYISLPIIAFFRLDYFLGSRVGGFWFHPTQASILAFSMYMIFLTRWLQQGGKINIILAVLLFFSAFLAGGKTGALGAAVALIALLVVARRLWLRTRILVVMCTFAIAGWKFFSNLEVGLWAHWMHYREYSNWGTLYSRFDLWKGAIKIWMDSPFHFLLGHGFGSSYVTGISSSSDMWQTTHAHNSFIQCLPHLGLFGTIPLLAVIFLATRNIIHYRRFLIHSSLLPLVAGFIVLLISSFLDDVFGGLLFPLFYLFVALVVAIESIVQLEKKEEESCLGKTSQMAT